MFITLNRCKATDLATTSDDTHNFTTTDKKHMPKLQGELPALSIVLLAHLHGA